MCSQESSVWRLEASNGSFGSGPPCGPLVPPDKATSHGRPYRFSGGIACDREGDMALRLTVAQKGNGDIDHLRVLPVRHSQLLSLAPRTPPLAPAFR